jgi:hypothetical protein
MPSGWKGVIRPELPAKAANSLAAWVTEPDQENAELRRRMTDSLGECLGERGRAVQLLGLHLLSPLRAQRGLPSKKL